MNIDNPYFEGMVNQIYPPELQLNKANISDTEDPFLDLHVHLSVANGFVSSKIDDKRDDFDFDIVNFLFLDGDVSRRASYGVYISQLIRFARVCNVCDALSYLLDNIYITFGTKLYRQIVGIPMGTNCAPLVADLFLYCYERDFMDSLNQLMLSRLLIRLLGTSMTF